MSKLMEGTERTKLEKWLRKNDSDVGFKQVTELMNLGSKEQLEEKMLEYAKVIQNADTGEDADEELERLRNQVADRKSVYKDQRTGAEKKTKLMAIAISERFGDAILDYKKP